MSAIAPTKPVRTKRRKPDPPGLAPLRRSETTPDEEAAVLRMIADLPPKARELIVVQEPEDGSPLVDHLQSALAYSIMQMANNGLPLMALAEGACAMAR